MGQKIPKWGFSSSHDPRCGLRIWHSLWSYEFIKRVYWVWARIRDDGQFRGKFAKVGSINASGCLNKHERVSEGARLHIFPLVDQELANSISYWCHADWFDRQIKLTFLWRTCEYIGWKTERLEEKQEDDLKKVR